jgi:predicted PurR-regulated permease PerM
MQGTHNSSSAAATDEPEESPEIGLQPVERTEMPLPSDFGVFFQGGLFILALLAALYVAQEINLPIVLAFILMLVLYPAMRLLERLRVPRILSALLLISLLISVVIGFGTALMGPAATWAGKLPLGVPRLQEHLSFLRGPVAAVQHFLQQAESYVSGDVPATATPTSAPPASSGIWMTLFTGTRAIVAGLLETVLVLFFLLLAGDIFLRRLVEILPRFSDKRQAVDISQQIERDISIYLVTITLMNAAVGIATAVVMWLCGFGDPLLWGAIAFLLNYVPILGPLLGVVTFVLAGQPTLVGCPAASRPVSGNSSHRGRDDHSHAVGPPLHAQSGARHPLTYFLVLDVGRAGRDSFRTHARHHQDHLRPGTDTRGPRAFSGRVAEFRFEFLLNDQPRKTAHPA